MKDYEIIQDFSNIDGTKEEFNTPIFNNIVKNLRFNQLLYKENFVNKFGEECTFIYFRINNDYFCMSYFSEHKYSIFRTDYTEGKYYIDLSKGAME